MSIAHDLDHIELNGKTYNIVGKPEHMPVSVYRASRKFAKAYEELEGDQEAAKAFTLENIGDIFDIALAFVRFALGEEQYTAAQADIEGMGLVEFKEFSFGLMGKYSNLTA